MKKYILFVIIIMATCLSNIATAQTIPSNISTAFSTKYPDAKIDKWKVSKDMYMVDFVLNKKKSVAYYDMSGNWMKTETKIRWSWNLPTDMQMAFKKSGYKPWYIESINQVDSPEQSGFVFTVDNRVMLDGDHIDAFLEKYKLYFSHDSLIKKEAID